MQSRYIIFEPENREIDINNIDEEYDYRVKLINPFKSYLTENSEKIKKQAFDQIYASINPEKKKRVEKSSTINNGLRDSILGFSSPNSNVLVNELEALSTKFNQSTIAFHNDSFIKTKENFEQFMKFFKDSCEVNNILTLDQKIDYLVYLRNTTNQKKEQQCKIKIIKISYEDEKVFYIILNSLLNLFSNN